MAKLSQRWRPKWNERTRLPFTLALVVVPAAALIILSIMHLRSIQRDRSVEAALQRDFQQMLAVSEKHLNQRATEMVDAAVADFPTNDDADVEEQLKRVMYKHPYVAHTFIYDPDREGHDYVYVSNPARMDEPDFEKECTKLEEDTSAWLPIEFKDLVVKVKKMKSWGMPYYFFYNNPQRGDHTMYQTVALFPLEMPGRTALGGVAFDADYLRNQFFPEMFDHLLPEAAGAPSSPEHNRAEHNHAVMMVRLNSKEAHPFVTSEGWDGGTPEVERKLESAFNGLVLGIKYRGTTVEAMGQRFVRTSFGILGGLSLLLVGGIFLVYRSVAREMALAKLKSDFVSNVSHELRTPLSLIRLYAETLEMGRIANADKPQAYYHIIRTESERLSALINNILDFSRIEAGRKEYEFRETDLPSLVRSTLDSYRDQIEQHGFSFEEHIDNNIPPVTVDREAIARSLLNLVNNALKYSANDKYLGVNLYRDNGTVKLEVVDHGIGIPRNEQNKVFEKFYRVGDPLVHNTKGSGLGLSLVRHIVHAHGGDVALESAPGKGSKFTVILPIDAGHRTVSMAAS
jgi:signal transduction histidine kinase